MLNALLALTLSSPALACPTVATGTPNALTYDVARTAIVRQGDRTTFTVSVNPQGDQQEFALVMPIPGLLEEGDIQVLDSGIFARLGGQTGVLTMDDAGCSTPDFGFVHPCPEGEALLSEGDDADGGGGSDEYGDVAVEAEYLVGEYQITLLSSTDSGDLFRWLDDHGYNLAEATIPVIQDYIDEGMLFMTAKVSEDATVADGTPLSPLQISYDSEMFGIPIRLAAASSPGQQDMLIYAITEPDSGRVGISNYSEMTVEDVCIWDYDDPDADFTEFYEARFDTAWQEVDQAGWSVEWAGESWSCSPCSSTQATADDLAQLGYDGGSEHFLTRLHVRYTPDTADQDLVLYESGIREGDVTSFANDSEQNRWCILPCNDALVDEALAEREARQEEGEREAQELMDELAEECDEQDDGNDGGQWPWSDGELSDSDDDTSSTRGCAAVSGTAGGASLLLGLLLAVGRRREDPAR